MISKFEIALKEANETENWLIVLKETEKLDAEKADLAHNKLIKIKILLIASIRTLKSKK